MEAITPTIVIQSGSPLPDEDPENEEIEIKVPELPREQNAEENAFARLVRTIQLIKKWTGRKEKEVERKDSFLRKFRMNAPNIDDAFINNTDEGFQVEKSSSSGSFKRCWRLSINPTGNWLYRWLFVVTVAVLYNAYLIIARETFDGLQTPLLPLWLTLDYMADLIYITDTVLQFFTGYLEQGLLVTDRKKLALHYVKTKNFYLDILSLVPTDILYAIPAIGVCHPIIRINRLFRMYRVFQFVDGTESRTNFPNIVRLATVVQWILLLIHWNGCFFFLISEGIGFGTDNWVYPNYTDPASPWASLTRQYVYVLWWSTLTLTTIGEVPQPEQDWEYVFVIIDFLVGVLIFATIVGFVGGIVTNINAARTEFQNKLDGIKRYMQYRNVDKELQSRVIKWFDYLWVSNKAVDERDILESLPDKLKAELAIHVHFATLKRVQIFEECEAGLLEELVLKLRPQVFSPGDYVCRKGDIGKEMYIVKHGKLEVVGDDGATILTTLTDGSYFGEISVLNLGGSGNRRTANVRSVGYSELFCLSKDDLLETLKEYPEAKTLLEEKGRMKLVRDGTMDENSQRLQREAATPQPSVTSAMARRIDQLEANLERLQSRFTRLYNEYDNSLRKLKQRITVLERSAQD